MIKFDSEAAVISAVKSSQTPLLLAVSFILIGASEHTYTILVLRWNKVEEGWLMIMGNVPQNEKLTLFVDYSVEQWMQNQNVPIQIWNINKHRHRINSAVKGWSSEINSAVGKQQRNIFLLVQKLKEAELVSCQLKSKKPGQPGQKRRKTYLCKRRRESKEIVDQCDKPSYL
jgi:type II secretory pathway predicted ATPase ExeA